MREEELCRELGELTRDRDRWRGSIPYAASLLAHPSVKIRAKALWLLGEMGLRYPLSLREHVPSIAAFLDSPEPLLRMRALNALGRIGRADFSAIEPYWAGMFRFSQDGDPGVRHAFVWASENIAAAAPERYALHMPVFEQLLADPDDRVRMEAPEMFRVVGRRAPELVRPYLARLRGVSESDANRVVRIHCLGAIRAASE